MPTDQRQLAEDHVNPSYDGNEDGKVDKADDADTLQGNAPADLGNDPDSVTTRFNGSNEIEDFEIIELIGDFENQDKAGWNGGVSNYDSPGADGSSYSAQFFDAGVELYQTFDLSGVFNLRVYWKVQDNQTGHDIEVRIDGTTIETLTNDSTNWREAVIPIHNYSGSSEIRFVSTKTGNDGGTYIDKIKLEKGKVLTETTDAGAN